MQNSTLIPPLIVYFNSPYSMEGTTLNNGKLNDSFYNTYKSKFGTSVNIKLNYNPTKFSNDSVCSTCNKFSELFLTNTNGILTEPIGNLTMKQSYLKLEQIKNIYNVSGIMMFNFYDRNLFNYGTIICNIKNDFFSIISDSNGNCGLNTIHKIKIIYADGYYDYLNFPFNPNIQNEIIIQIDNGIRKMIIPDDPSGLYIPFFIDKNNTKNLLPVLYSEPFTTSTFINNNLVMEEYNLNTDLYFDKITSINVGKFNISTIINKNIFPNNYYDALFLELFTVNNTNPLVASGNFIGFVYSYKYDPGSVGFLTNTNTVRFPLILVYGDGDFDYLNVPSDVYKFYHSIIEIEENSYRTIYMPLKPPNYVPPTINYPPNSALPNKTIYNNFYLDLENNSSLYDNSAQNQNITLFSNIYESIDPVTGNPTNPIGKYVVYKYIFTSNSQTYTLCFNYFSFENEEYFTSVYAIKNNLNKNGNVIPEQLIKSTILASSDGYGYFVWFVKLNTFNNYSYCQVGYLQQ